MKNQTNTNTTNRSFSRSLLLAGIFLLTSLGAPACLPVSTPPATAAQPEEIQIVILPNNLAGGCGLSKVRVFDNHGDIYQAEGCNDGVITFPAGRSFGWVELLGVQTIGFSIYSIRP